MMTRPRMRWAPIVAAFVAELLVAAGIVALLYLALLVLAPETAP